MSTVTTVRLIRHGESEGNAGARTTDAATMGLTPEGRRQAEVAAERLTAPPTLIVCSAYRRAAETAEPTRRRFPGVPVETWPVQELTCLASDACRDTTTAERRGAVDAYWQAADPHRVEGEGAESFAAFLARVEEVWERLRRIGAGRVVVFTHRKFISALLWTGLSPRSGLSSRRMRHYRGFDQSLPVPNGAQVDIELRGGGPWFGPVDPQPGGGAGP